MRRCFSLSPKGKREGLTFIQGLVKISVCEGEVKQPAPVWSPCEWWKVPTQGTAGMTLILKSEASQPKELLEKKKCWFGTTEKYFKWLCFKSPGEFHLLSWDYKLLQNVLFIFRITTAQKSKALKLSYMGLRSVEKNKISPPVGE